MMFRFVSGCGCEGSRTVDGSKAYGVYDYYFQFKIKLINKNKFYLLSICHHSYTIVWPLTGSSGYYSFTKST